MCNAPPFSPCGRRSLSAAKGDALARLYRKIVPQMTLWLPEEEAEQLRFEFETEMARLEAA
jgi:hypothetical protein